MTPADIIALKALAFATEVRTYGFTDIEAETLLDVALAAVDSAQITQDDYFQSAMRRMQIVNRVSSTCQRLKRGTAGEHQEGEVK